MNVLFAWKENRLTETDGTQNVAAPESEEQMRKDDHGPRQIALRSWFLDVWRFVTSWKEMGLEAEIPICWGKASLSGEPVEKQTRSQRKTELSVP